MGKREINHRKVWWPLGGTVAAILTLVGLFVLIDRKFNPDSSNPPEIAQSPNSIRALPRAENPPARSPGQQNIPPIMLPTAQLPASFAKGAPAKDSAASARERRTTPRVFINVASVPFGDPDAASNAPSAFGAADSLPRGRDTSAAPRAPLHLQLAALIPWEAPLHTGAPPRDKSVWNTPSELPASFAKDAPADNSSASARGRRTTPRVFIDVASVPFNEP